MSPWSGLAISMIGLLAAESYAVIQGWRSPRRVALMNLPLAFAAATLFLAARLYLPQGVKAGLLILFFVAAISGVPALILLAMYRSSKIRPPPGTVWTPPPEEEVFRLTDIMPLSKLVVYLALFPVVPLVYVSLRIPVTNWRADLITVLAVTSLWSIVSSRERRARGKK